MLDAVRNIPLFADVIAQQEGCLLFLERGVELWLQAGERAATEGESVEYFYVILEGELQITKQIGGQETVINSYGPGTYFGETPLLMDTPYVATARAVRRTQLYGLSKDIFWKMLATCPTVRREVLQKMGRRISDLESLSQSHDRLASLSTLAAGLAHELNNPAAAARRAAGQLRDAVERLQPVDCDLRRRALAMLPKNFFADVRRDVAERATLAAQWDTLARSDREQELADALDAHGLADAWELAPGLTDAGLDAVWLEWLAPQVPAEVLGDVLGWLDASLAARGLLDEVEQSTRRVSELVEAVKAYSFMDQAPQQDVDIRDGLENTLAVLAYRIKAQNARVTCEFAPGLPRIPAYGSELNQVWTNLIDNALDAVGTGGQVWICVSREPERILVEIGDNGPGIPPEIQGRIFEPFYTTKGVGQGTGLGLDMAYRSIVTRHRGDVRVLSQPGDTRFQVRLPLTGSEAARV